MTQNLSKYRELRDDSLWTPQVIYEVQPPNQLVRDGYDYGEGTDNYDDAATDNSLFSGVRDFFENVFGSLGRAVSGVAEAGIGLVVKVFDGIVNLATSVGNMIGNVFGSIGELIFGRKKPPPEPLPDIFSPIEADLEGELEPFFQEIDDALAESSRLGDEAKGYAQDALDIATEANEAVHDAAGVIRGLVDEGHAAAESAKTKAAEASAAAGNAINKAAEAAVHADNADKINEEVKVSKLAVDAAVTAGEGHVSTAKSHAAAAAASAADALESLGAIGTLRDEVNTAKAAAEKAVTDGRAEVTKAKAEVTKAQQASTAAGTALSAAQSVKVDVTASAEEVAIALSQVVGYHGEVLQAHDEAITAATAAAGSATEASNKALDAASANTSAISAMNKANQHRDAAITAASNAAGEASAAAKSASSAAGEALEATRVLGEIADKQTEINTSLTQAVNAASEAAASAGNAAKANSEAIKQVGIATQKALDAANANASALVAASDAATKAEEASLLAQNAQSARDDAQDAAARANADSIKAVQQYITRVMFLPDSSKVNSVNNPHWEVTFSNGKRKLVAKDDPKWVGEWIYHSAVARSGDFGPVIEGGTVSAANREFLLDTASSAASLQYTIRPGIARLASPSSVSGWIPTRDRWVPFPVSDSDNSLVNGVFTAKTAGEHEIMLRAGWDATTREDSYGIRLRRQAPSSTAQEFRRVFQTGIGPLLPGQNGYRTQSISVSVNLVKGEKIYLEAWAGATGTDQRKMRDSKIQVGWVDEPSDTSDVT